MATTGDLIAHDTSELSTEDFQRYVELVKANTLESIAAANSIWGNARADAAAVAEMLALIAAEPTEEMREELHTEIKRNETRLIEIQEKISQLAGAKFRLESKLAELKNNPVFQRSSPLHGHALSMRLTNQVLKAAISDELRAAGLIS